jgi:hypothetical protein
VVVGGHLDFLYSLPGPLPAGSYTIVVNAIAEGAGGVLDAEVDDLLDGGAIALLDSASYTQPADAGFAEGMLINATQTLPAFAASCGDVLRLRVTMLSGPPDGYFDSIQPVLTIP